ncbi:hypothetical protein DFH09DRAFT_1287620 [Mycena vulgaris]|nr:hypothetical protein DFH09DRAFT_1287620 [Mycena vulgaris]
MIFVVDTPPLDPEAEDEGLLVFVQTGQCRRLVLTRIYNNKSPNPIVPCCDICCPELLNKTRPGKPPVIPRQSAVKRGEINKDVQIVLHRWRIGIKARDFSTSLFAASAILRDETVALLSSVGPVDSRERLQKVLAGQWTWWEEYGEELYKCLAAQDIPPMKPLPAKKRASKRPAEAEFEGDAGGIITSKRHHAEPTITATPAADAPVASGSSAAPEPRKAPPRKRAGVKSPEEIKRLNDEAFAAADAENLRRAQALFSTFHSQQPSKDSNSMS